MRIYNARQAVVLGVAALFIAIVGQCQGQGQGSLPGPSQQDIGRNTQGSRTAPLASGSDQGGQLPCNAGGRSGSVGGYQPVADRDEQSSIKKDLAPLAFQEFASTHNVAGCVANTVTPTGSNITKACKQVVAGINYAFEFYSSYDCTTPSNKPASGSVLLNSIVYKPLPSGSQNAKPQVTKVWNATTS